MQSSVEIQTKEGHVVWKKGDDGVVHRWCEVYNETGQAIAFEDEESAPYIHTVLIPFLNRVLLELQAHPEGAFYANHLPEVLEYARRRVHEDTSGEQSTHKN